MAYTIYHADGTAVPVPNAVIYPSFYDGTVRGVGVGIQLVGDRAVDYGGPIAQNFLQMTENFASNSAPTDATSLHGQLWFNKATAELYVKKYNNPAGGLANWEKIATYSSSGEINGTATTAANIAGGTAGSLVYQTGPGTTAFISGSTLGHVLTSTGPSTAPTWQAPLSSAVTSIVAGTNVSISPVSGIGAVTINATSSGSVTSVGVTTTSSRITVSGSPVTTSGSIALDLATTGVTAAAYTNASITVDAYGRITSAASGAAGSGLGYGQTWQSFTGSRALGTTYYNLTLLPIMVAVTATGNNPVSPGVIQATCGGVAVSQAWTSDGAGTWTPAKGNVTFVVPSLASYSVSEVGAGSTLTLWSELR